MAKDVERQRRRERRRKHAGGETGRRTYTHRERERLNAERQCDLSERKRENFGKQQQSGKEKINGRHWYIC